MTIYATHTYVCIYTFDTNYVNVNIEKRFGKYSETVTFTSGWGHFFEFFSFIIFKFYNDHILHL